MRDNSLYPPDWIKGERISIYYFTDRYPQLVSSGLTYEDVEKDREEAKQFIRMMFPEEDVNG
jgi:hypothetical protein